MKKNKPYTKIGRYGIWLWLVLTAMSLQAQEETVCSPFGEFAYDNEVIYNFGAGANVEAFLYRTDVIIGQPLVATQFPVGGEFESVTGAYARFLLPPEPPLLLATQGDHPDFVQVQWVLNRLSPTPVEFRIFRNGSFLTKVDGDVFEFLDFNVQAGNIYEYKIIAYNEVGTPSLPGFQTGFVNPNGVVTGQVQTRNGNPVPGAIVKISPSFGNAIAFNGAGEHACVSWDDALNTPQWTVSTWIKMGNSHDGEGIIDLGSDLNKNWWIRSTPSAEGKGVIVGLGDGSTASEKTMLFANDPDEWHHVAVSYNGTSATLYLDGEYMGFVKGAVDFEPTRFSIGRTRDGSAYFVGSVDDVRIYSEALTQTDIILRKDISESSRTENLLAYWKFDEGIGTTSFDITDRGLDAQIYGGSFTDDAPELMNAGMTDVNGNYLIEGINYSQTSNFRVHPEKLFYENYSLEFNAGNQAYATLPDFDLPDNSTLEVVFLPYDTETRQTVLSKGSHLELYVDMNQYYLSINGVTNTIGAPSGQFEHFAITMDGTTNQVIVYQNGNEVANFSNVTVAGDWTGDDWVVGALDASFPSNYFTGLVDEVVAYESVFPQADIQLLSAFNINDPAEENRLRGSLVADYNFNESEGTELYDFGPSMFADGVLHNANYSIIARTQETNPHEFEPNARNVNLNFTSTSVTNIDFTDISTVSVSGIVRFENTFCYQDSVEILVNGGSYFPPIYTNEEGRFVADFEPGSNLILTPKFGRDTTAHEFFPAFYEVRQLNVPVANILLQNLTKREIIGQVFGGHCRTSIIADDGNGNPTAIVKVKLAALNGCYEEVKQLPNIDGKFNFTGVPPIPVNVSVIEHSNNVIYDFFQVQGGEEIDLREIKKDTVDFMYISAPNVEIGEINDAIGTDCDLGGIPIIHESFVTRPNLKEYYNEIRVFQQYDGGKCYLDTFNLTINNGLQESEQQNEVSDSSVFVYSYLVNNPNLLGDHKKSMQVVAEVGGATASATFEAIVLGQRQKENTILTRSPGKIFTILHDPPGDGSSATYSSGKRQCEGWESANVNSIEAGADLEFEFGKKVSVFKGAGLGVFVGTISEAEIFNTTTFKTSFETNLNNQKSAEFCWELVNEISTSDGDDIWGQYGDVYFGAALNFEIGARDVLDYDFENCSFVDTIVFSVNPADTFSTEFVYTEWQILTDVIPNLRATGELQDSLDADRWMEAVTENRKRVAKMGTPLDSDGLDTIYTPIFTTVGVPRIIGYDVEIIQNLPEFNAPAFNNITFDAGASYTQTLTNSEERTHSFTYDIQIGEEIETEFGFELFGSGSSQTFNVGYSHTFEEQENGSTSNETTTEFTLADDDINDFYSVDVAYDPVYGTPMFKLRGGETMCPWIPGTRNREEVFAQVDNPVAINVPSNTPAVFRITLGNIGPNGDDGLVYELGVDEGGNPDGAIIKVDGAPIINPLEFQFIGSSTVEKTITVEYPNTGQFDFEDLGLYFASVCQIEHSESVGYDAGDGGFLIYDQFGREKGDNFYNRFYKPIELDVHFIEPCSPIDIGFPMQNHVVTPGNENLNITLNEYVNTDPDLELVRVQYRPRPGDGSWINILELPASEFANDPVFKIVQWDMDDLKDGNYELRAITQCFDVTLAPGISEVILIRKETEAPELFGAPEPADGVLTTGDEISITFNESINCTKVFDADGIGTDINLNNIALINTETGALVPFSHQCVNDKIIITPEIESRFINGKTLRAIATDIEDLAGNKMEVPTGAPGSPTVNYKEWEFLVDLNPLRWQAGSNIDEVIEEGTLKTITRNIVNRSGSTMAYTITGPRIDNLDGSVTYEDIPLWMITSPLGGTLDPGEVRPITFVFPQDLVANFYSSEINVVGTQGNHKIDADLRVICAGPVWNFDPSDYTYTMNMTLQLDIEGDLSEDRMDRVGAFVDEQLRGWAYIQFEQSVTSPSNPDGTYFAFLTIYSNEFSGEDIQLKIWDVSDCTLYGAVMEDFTYEADGVVGSPLEPQVVHTMNLVARTIQIHEGWNWISYNLDLPDESINAALATLTQPEQGLIKNQTEFSVYSTGDNAFVGGISDLTHETMYQYRSMADDSLVMLGMPIDPATAPIDVVAGWNWLGFIPQQGMPLTDALASLTPLNGDIIKSQIAFAQYVAGTGWIGNLNFMSSPNGYLLNISNDGTLTYPSNYDGPPVVDERSPDYTPYWEIQPELYQYTMNIIGVVVDETSMIEEGDEVAAFVNGEIRGIGQAVYIDGIEGHLIFFTGYANGPDEEMTFQFYDRSADRVYDLNERFAFEPNAIYGMIESPEVWTMSSVSNTTNLDQSGYFEVFPNPATERVYLRFNNEKAEKIVVRITDALGRQIERLETDAAAGELTLEWMPTGLAEGMYFITLDRAESSLTRRVRIK